MFKKIFVVLIAFAFILGASALSFAQGNDTTGVEQSKAVNVGNKICPVSGEKIDEKTKATYEYEGKVYNFCCAMCIDEFKKDPEKYIKKIEEEKKAEVKEENKMIKMPEMPMGMHEGQGH